MNQVRYYRVYEAEELGYHPQVILAGRSINDSMPGHVARMAIMGLNDVGMVIRGSKVLIMGLTYKEDVPDIRESPVFEIVRELKAYKIEVYGYDPLLSDEMIERLGVKALPGLDLKMDAVIMAVGHRQFREMGVSEIRGLMNDFPVIVDIRDCRPGEAEEMGMRYGIIIFTIIQVFDTISKN